MHVDRATPSVRECLHGKQSGEQAHEKQYVFCGECIHRSAPSIPDAPGSYRASQLRTANRVVNSTMKN
jgi:hypothetical protein